MTRRCSRWTVYDFNSDSGERSEGSSRRIDLVFVCNEFRRSGIASFLVQEAARHFNVPPEALVWRLPFATDEGRALAEKFARDGRMLITK